MEVGGICAHFKYQHLAEVEGVKSKVSRGTVLLIHVNDGGYEEDFRQRNPEQELPHGALLNLSRSNSTRMAHSLSVQSRVLDYLPMDGYCRILREISRLLR